MRSSLFPLLSTSYSLCSFISLTCAVHPLRTDLSSDQSLKSKSTRSGEDVNSEDVASRIASSTTSTHNNKRHKGVNVGCASPEVLVNGSPSPDILETVNGERVDSQSSSSEKGIGNIQEIQFVGTTILTSSDDSASSYSSSSSSSLSSSSASGSDPRGNRTRKRICKIKCLNGVWVGPLCSIEPGMDPRHETPSFSHLISSFLFLHA